MSYGRDLRSRSSSSGINMSSSRPHSSSSGHHHSNTRVREAKEWIQHLRVQELQMFLGVYGQSKVGRKIELQERACSLIASSMDGDMYRRLKQLYTTRVGSTSSGPTSYPPLVNPSATRESTGSVNSSSNSPRNLSMPSLAGLWSQPSSLISGSSSSSRLNHHPVQEWKVPGNSSSLGRSHGHSTPEFVELSSYKFSSLPFFEQTDCLIPSTNLNPTIVYTPGCRSSYQECVKTFTLSIEQANSITCSRKIMPNMDIMADGSSLGFPQTKVEFKNQLLIRFALMNMSGELKTVEDCFPPNLCLKVNGKIVPLPPVLPVNKNQPKEQFRQSRPVDITSSVKLSPVVSNTVSISWVHPSLPLNSNLIDYNKRFCFILCLVHKLSSDDLVNKIKSKGVKAVEFTQSIIKDKLRDEDAEIATTSLRASLICPLGKMRIRNPGRSVNCTHIQCFDISFFLLMNEKKPTWTCPVCDRKLPFSSLVIDGLFTEILSSDKSLSTTEVQFDEVNGMIEWKPIIKEDKKTIVDAKASMGSKSIAAINELGSQQGVKRKEREDNSTESASPAKTLKPNEPEVVDILSDSEDSKDTVIASPSASQSFICPPSETTGSIPMVNLSDDEGSPPLDFSTSSTLNSSQTSSPLEKTDQQIHAGSSSTTPSSLFNSSSQSFNPFHPRRSDYQRGSSHGFNPFANPGISPTQASSSNFFCERESLYASIFNSSHNNNNEDSLWKSSCTTTASTISTVTSTTSSNTSSISQVLGSAFNSLASSSSSSTLLPPPPPLTFHAGSLSRTTIDEDDDDDIAIIE